MNTKITYRTVLGATCFFLMACGQANNSSGESANQVQADAVTSAPPTAQEWESVYFDWSAEENYPEDACAEGRVMLTSNGTLNVRDCKESRKATISSAELASFEQQLETVLSSLKKPTVCNGDRIADYAQNWKLVDGNGQVIEIYRFDIENTCGKVANVNEINDFLYVLKEKYFPRIEEGIYE